MPGGWPPELAGAGIVAVRVADLGLPAAAAAAGGGPERADGGGRGDDPHRGNGGVLKPVAVAAAVVRRDGRVQAGGHPAGHARLGIIEQQLDEMTGTPGVIDRLRRRPCHTGRSRARRGGA